MRKLYQSNKKLFAAILLIQFFGVGLICFDYWSSTAGFSKMLRRNDPGLGDYEQEVYITSKQYTGVYDVNVAERKLENQEAKKLFQKAEKEIDKTFLGENKSLDCIQKDVVLSDSYVDEKVAATWSFDNYDVIHSDGTLQLDRPKKKTMVEASALLTCGNQESVYQFFFCVVPPKKGSAEAFFSELQEAISTERGTEKEVVLPTKIAGETVKWKKKMKYRGLWIVLLAAGTGVSYPFLLQWEEQRKRAYNHQQLMLDYPAVLSQLSLLLRVGISLPEAISRIAIRYEKQGMNGKEKRMGFELLLRLHRELKDGTSEGIALEHFGKLGEIKEYRKLALLLQQMGHQGSQHMMEQLDREDIEAFSMRKAYAKRAGEEASTKLLIPMIGMLGIVLVILLVPALWMLKQA